jgi:hypothetical protein
MGSRMISSYTYKFQRLCDPIISHKRTFGNLFGPQTLRILITRPDPKGADGMSVDVPSAETLGSF